MCSIAGIISPDQSHITPEILERMNLTLKHRGADDDGYYIHRQNNIHIGFAHNRLSILDLSKAAAQPLKYLSRYVLVFNGEIYNYKELRAQLKGQGYAFTSTGDTELVAAAFDAFGPGCLEFFDGMFALAIWDEVEYRLFCAKDRFGEKPFYYHYNEAENCFQFASEIKALLKNGVNGTFDPTMLYNFLTLGLTRQPDRSDKTFYSEIYQLPAANYLVYEPLKQQFEIIRYWDLDKETTIDANEEKAISGFMDLFASSVSKRMRSDVPVGTSLSGGLDSSSIIAMANELHENQYSHKAFSAIFPGFEKDESAHIKSTANKFDLELYTVTPDANYFIDNLQVLIAAQDEPFSSASVLAQYLVYGKAKEQGVKVLLDGQGADEVLAGYGRYTHWYLQELVQSVGWENANKEARLYKENGFLSSWSWKNRIASAMPSVTANLLEKRALRYQKLNRYLQKDFVSEASDRRSLYKPTVEKLNDIQYHDLMVMGLEELLRYADRNSMAHGREVRLPFLSHELVQYVLSLPSSYRMRNGYTKWLLRKSMEKKLPKEICWQKNKIGFEPPQKFWMEQPATADILQVARKKLVEKNICHPQILKKPVVATGAHDKENFDFRCLIAGIWIDLK